MTIGIPKETFPGEHRVALIPSAMGPLVKAGHAILVEAGAGAAAGFPDQEYADKGAKLVASRAEVFGAADVVLQVRAGGANAEAGRADLALMKPGQAVIAFLEPLTAKEAMQELASRGVHAFSMELMPRITRAQSMDALSSMATIAGYKAVLMAAMELPRMFPMMMTAAGTVAPAHVFVVGAGVAGLQAIASARKLGARVEAYDVRPAVKEQIQSLGAKFVELPLETADTEDKGGYAKEADESFYRRQREMMAKVVAGSDVVITTAAIPGKKSPVLVTADMVHGDGARLGDRRPGGRARRQLRADEGRRARGGARRHDPGPDQPRDDRAVPRQPDVLEEHHDLPPAPDQGRPDPDGRRRRDRARDAHHRRRPDRQRARPAGAGLDGMTTEFRRNDHGMTTE